MPIKWSFNQAVELETMSRDVRSGVCMVMSYYVCKRILAGLETTPDILRRKMPMFASMQRAGQGDVKLSGVGWVEMLARGDNLNVKVGEYKDTFEEAFALGNVGAELPDAVSCFVEFKWQHVGHAVVMGAKLKGKQKLWMFDPNVGLVKLKGDDDMQLILGKYPTPGKIGVVLLWGTPRDMKMLAAD